MDDGHLPSKGAWRFTLAGRLQNVLCLWWTQILCFDTCSFFYLMNKQCWHILGTLVHGCLWSVWIRTRMCCIWWSCFHHCWSSHMLQSRILLMHCFSSPCLLYGYHIIEPAVPIPSSAPGSVLSLLNTFPYSRESHLLTWWPTFTENKDFQPCGSYGLCHNSALYGHMTEKAVTLAMCQQNFFFF